MLATNAVGLWLPFVFLTSLQILKGAQGDARSTSGKGPGGSQREREKGNPESASECRCGRADERPSRRCMRRGRDQVFRNSSNSG